MSSKFIRVKELQFVRDRGRTYTADGDRTITMRISQIVSITDEKYRNCSKYCIVSLTNGQILVDCFQIESTKIFKSCEPKFSLVDHSRRL